MPTPSRTSLEAVVRAAAAVLEESGASGLTMQAVAARVGVRAPSLYKHVAGRDALVRLVADDAARGLGERLREAAPPGGDPRAGLAAAARTLRAFAHERPGAFRLVFAPTDEATRPSPEVATSAAEPVLRLAGELAGPEHALVAARTVTAWASGFVSMELADAFRLPGEVDAAFDYGVERLVDALAGPAPAVSRRRGG